MTENIEPAEDGSGALLTIEDLTLAYRRRRRVTPVLRGVSLQVAPGETLGVVGESGSGKSQTALAAIRLLGDGAETAGTITFDGAAILDLREEQMRRLRGSDIAMVFQDPMTSLDPVMRIGDQIAEALRAHPEVTQDADVAGTVQALVRQVGLPDPERLVHRYPHQLSGGQRQRVGIAMAMANRPRLLIADEPTTALDVTVQAQVLELLDDLRRRTRMAMILITHDLALVSEHSDRVAIMYAGEIVEEGPTLEVFANPRHPYTQGLLRSRPRLDGPGRLDGALSTIPGASTDAASVTSGCAFLERCTASRDEDLCRRDRPALEGEVTHRWRCHFPVGVDPVGEAPVGDEAAEPEAAEVEAAEPEPGGAR